MPPCNHNLMAQFSCEELRERRQRADANIASDQRRSRQLEAALRYNEIQTANIRAEIDRLRNELSPPSLPGPRRRAKVGQRRPRRGLAKPCLSSSRIFEEFVILSARLFNLSKNAKGYCHNTRAHFGS